MQHDPCLSSAEYRQIARSAVYHAAHDRFGDLFPHLARIRDERIDWRGEPSIHLARAAVTIDQASITADIRDAIDRLRLLIYQSSERDRAVMRRHGIAGEGRETLEELGRRYGCTRERIRQVQARIDRRMRDQVVLVGSVKRSVAHLREAIGAGWLIESLDDVPGLRGTELTDVDRLETTLLFWAAGPFDQVDGWIIRRPSGRLLEASRQALRRATSRGPIELDDATERLARVGIDPRMAESWIRAFARNVVVDGLVIRSARTPDPTPQLSIVHSGGIVDSGTAGRS